MERDRERKGECVKRAIEREREKNAALDAEMGPLPTCIEPNID